MGVTIVASVLTGMGLIFSTVSDKMPVMRGIAITTPPFHTPWNDIPQSLICTPMNRFTAHKKQGDSKELDRQYQNSPTLWSTEADRLAWRTQWDNTSVAHSTSSSTLSVPCANGEISETRKKSPPRTASATRDLCRLLPPPCPPQEPHFVSWHSHVTAAPQKLASDHKLSSIDVNESDDLHAQTDRTLLVTPGQWMRLRGADETRHAIQQDFYKPCICFDCCSDIFCISDAWLVLCPHCRSISPLERDDVATEGGVGLGFTISTIVEVLADAGRGL
jgi:hypothetical protein